VREKGLTQRQPSPDEVANASEEGRLDCRREGERRKNDPERRRKRGGLPSRRILAGEKKGKTIGWLTRGGAEIEAVSCKEK